MSCHYYKKHYFYGLQSWISKKFKLKVLEENSPSGYDQCWVTVAEKKAHGEVKDVDCFITAILVRQQSISRNRFVKYCMIQAVKT